MTVRCRPMNEIRPRCSPIALHTVPTYTHDAVARSLLFALFRVLLTFV